MRPFFKKASHYVHASPSGLRHHLGLPDEETDIILAGPSSIGLGLPGHSAALSLTQATIALLLSKPNLDRFVECAVLSELEREAKEAFSQVEIECSNSNEI